MRATLGGDGEPTRRGSTQIGLFIVFFQYCVPEIETEGWALVSDDDYDAMAEACIAAGDLVMQHGSQELRGLMLATLYTLGREIAARRDARANGCNGEGHPFDNDGGLPE